MVVVNLETILWWGAAGKLVPHRLTDAAVAAGVTLVTSGPPERCISCGFMLAGDGEARILGHHVERYVRAFEPLCSRDAAGLGLLEELKGGA